MSRIGKLKITLPQGTKASLVERKLTVKGKLGELSLDVHPNITVEIEGDEIRALRHSDLPADRALHGLVRALAANMVHGVSEGFTKILEIQGVGYRADMKNNALVLSVGYSHPVEFVPPEGIKIEVDKQNNITVSGIDKERVGQVSADIRAFRPPDKYKGKGIRYRGERIKLKQGKSRV
ncbi:MAG: 50S ribosomal protein L6 [bacterium]